MDQNSILELTKINGTLTIIAVLLAILVIVHLFNMFGNLINNWRSYRTKLINTKSIEMHDRADYVELEKYLEKTLGRFPNNPTAIYWMARCNLDQSKIDIAKKLFIKLKGLEPTWEDSCVTPYLKEIDEKH